jgi:glycosyltransferase involved in cell wall biosynthesis
MKIDVICNDGSPLGVTLNMALGKVPGRIGVGGAELALLTMCEAWHKNGKDITLYNNPNNPLDSPFPQRHLDTFMPGDDRDILIIFRSPNIRIREAKGKKVWWSTDQLTVGDFQQFAPTVDKIVTISKFHEDYFKAIYGITNTVSIDLPVRTWEYEDKVEKVDKRCIFTSIPDRGVMQLHKAWTEIVARVPDASLVITSDWRLWADWMTEDAIRVFRLTFSRLPNVNYLGAVTRDVLIQNQLMASIHLYPCIYDELFCISVAESQVAGAYPITSNFGALGTTNMGMVLHGNPQNPDWITDFVEKTVEMLNDPDLPKKQKRIRELAIKRFSIERILKAWDNNVFSS